MWPVRWPGKGEIVMPHKPKPAIPRGPKRRYPSRQSQVGSYTNSAWRRVRKRILLRDPYCSAPGCHRASEIADHIVSRRAGGSDDETNLQGLCKRCHNGVTNKFEGGWGLPLRRGKPGTER